MAASGVVWADEVAASGALDEAVGPGTTAGLGKAVGVVVDGVGMVTLEAPSTVSVALVIQHVVQPKEVWLAGLGIDAKWPACGFPDAIHLDNAKVGAVVDGVGMVTLEAPSTEFTAGFSSGSWLVPVAEATSQVKKTKCFGTGSGGIPGRSVIVHVRCNSTVTGLIPWSSARAANHRAAFGHSPFIGTG